MNVSNPTPASSCSVTFVPSRRWGRGQPDCAPSGPGCWRGHGTVPCSSSTFQTEQGGVSRRDLGGFDGGRGPGGGGLVDTSRAPWGGPGRRTENPPPSCGRGAGVSHRCCHCTRCGGPALGPHRRSWLVALSGCSRGHPGAGRCLSGRPVPSSIQQAALAPPGEPGPQALVFSCCVVVLDECETCSPSP